MTPRNLHRRVRGLSIVELMVAMVLSLVGTIVIFQVYAVNEDVRRTTTAGSDEQTSGMVALMLLERELRHGGYGLNDSALLGCNLVTWDTAHSPNRLQVVFDAAGTVGDPPLAPVQIVSNKGSIPDVIRVMYAGSTMTTVPVKLAMPMDTLQDPLVMKYVYGLRAGDMIAVGEGGPGSDCTIREVTSVADIQLNTITGTYTDWAGVTKKTRWNDPTGTPQKYQPNVGKVINLGTLTDDTRPPRYNEITVQTGMVDPSLNNKLTVTNLWGEACIGTNCPPAMAEQVVQLKAEYGMDDGETTEGNVVQSGTPGPNDGIVDRYTTGPIKPGEVDKWKQVKTVRVAIVTRSAQMLKPTSGNKCDATPDFDPDPKNNVYPVRWARGPDAPNGHPIDVRSPADPADKTWQCYKYLVYETTVPLRNVLWSPL
jgi:type IV pilus assembly protein PilW